MVIILIYLNHVIIISVNNKVSKLQCDHQSCFHLSIPFVFTFFYINHDNLISFHSSLSGHHHHHHPQFWPQMDLVTVAKIVFYQFDVFFFFIYSWDEEETLLFFDIPTELIRDYWSVWLYEFGILPLCRKHSVSHNHTLGFVSKGHNHGYGHKRRFGLHRLCLNRIWSIFSSHEILDCDHHTCHEFLLNFQFNLKEEGRARLTNQKKRQEKTIKKINQLNQKRIIIKERW